MVDEMNDGVANLSGVVRRDVRRHANGDAGRAVNHQVGQARGEHYRFAQGSVEVIYEVNGVFVDVDEHLFGDGAQPRFGVAHGGGRVVIHASEVALTVNQRQTHREVLREPHHRLIHGVVVMRVILAEHLTHKARALLVSLCGAHAQLIHCVQDAALYPASNHRAQSGSARATITLIA